MFNLQGFAVSFVVLWRREREQNLFRNPPYISLLYFDLNLSTPNKPQPIYIALPYVALG